MPGSMWAATLPEDERVVGPPLDGDVDVDVAVIGAGYTGLWTAYHLARLDPSLTVAVLERHEVGFGASGRNGGWCSALLATSLTSLAATHGRPAATAMQRAMIATVGEIADVLAEEAIDAGVARSGTLTLARTVAQRRRLADEVAEARSFGFGEDDLRWLDGDELAARCRAEGAVGGLYTPHCLAVHPLRLAHGLAGAAVRRGVRLHEGTTVTAVQPGRVQTDRGRVRAAAVVQATEAYTATFPDRHREVVPLYSLMVATDPLSDAQWAAIGLAGRETFADARHLVIYGQRTADGRLAFGGRGAPYHFGSRVEPGFDVDDQVRTHLVATVRELFPVLDDVPFPYHWGGPLGVPRDWRWSVRFDETTGLATAGGYVGDGVGTTHLAGRILAELITGQRSERCSLLAVGHRPRRWEIEPLRWLGVNLVRRAAERADAAEASTGRFASARARGWSRALGLFGPR